MNQLNGSNGGPEPAAVAGLVRSDVRGPGLARVRETSGFSYLDEHGAPVTDAATLSRITALAIPPAWRQVWISPDPWGHIQVTGVDSQGRLQYRYHPLWREQRDAQKFQHMLRFARALPRLREACLADLRRRDLDRDRVTAGVVRLIDLGLFRIGGERYAELDHHYGATTLEKRHVTFSEAGMEFNYVAKEGKRRVIDVSDPLVTETVRALARSHNGLDTLFAFQLGGDWHPLHTHDVGAYIADRAAGHFTAKEFRTWNATLLMALALANVGQAQTERARLRAVAAGIREVATWLGDTPSVVRTAYVDPRLVERYRDGDDLPGVPHGHIGLPAAAEAEVAVTELLEGLPARPAAG